MVNALLFEKRNISSIYQQFTTNPTQAYKLVSRLSFAFYMLIRHNADIL
jgi:hypothetical protein